MPALSSPVRFARSGALAGAVSTLLFCAVHDLLISDIWGTLPAMLAAGVLCGACLGGSYAVLAAAPSVGGWVRYNLLYVGVLALLGLTSFVLFEPVTTVAAVLATNAPPTELFAQAMPVTVGFTLGAVAVLGRLYARRPRDYAVLALTVTILVLLLGLNVSVLGLVHISGGLWGLIAELFALIGVLALVHTAVFAVLERRQLRAVRRPTAASG